MVAATPLLASLTISSAITSSSSATITPLSSSTIPGNLGNPVNKLLVALVLGAHQVALLADGVSVGSLVGSSLLASYSGKVHDEPPGPQLRSSRRSSKLTRNLVGVVAVLAIVVGLVVHVDDDAAEARECQLS